MKSEIKTEPTANANGSYIFYSVMTWTFFMAGLFLTTDRCSGQNWQEYQQQMQQYQQQLQQYQQLQQQMQQYQQYGNQGQYGQYGNQGQYGTGQYGSQPQFGNQAQYGQKPSQSSTKGSQQGKSNLKPTLKGKRVKHSQQPFSFLLPDGWSYRESPAGVMFGHKTIAGMILLTLHTSGNTTDMKQEMAQGVTDDGLSLRINGAFSSFGQNGLSVPCSGVAQGQAIKGYAFGRVAWQYGGVYVMAIATPQVYSKALEEAARSIALSAKSTLDENGPAQLQLTAHFTGAWKRVTKYRTSIYRLYGDGTFTSHDESCFSGSFSGGGSWGNGNEENGKGRWSVRGTADQGFLILQPAGEAQYQVPYQVHTEGGQKFYNEYIFDGELYSKIN